MIVSPREPRSPPRSRTLVTSSGASKVGTGDGTAVGKVISSSKIMPTPVTIKVGASCGRLVGVADGIGVSVGVCDGVGVLLGVGVGPGVSVCATVGVSVGAGVCVSVLAMVAVGLGSTWETELNPRSSSTGSVLEHAETMAINATVSQMAKVRCDVVFIIIFRQRHARYEQK